ncbi:phospho-sugar mutase [uncultured Rummeliibacillus sp.]|uniref:phospho-sugar mutase n=1 Tax=uncultured Rummeliibacillus sp. TaxID=762292 RepID=UPI00261C1FA9|nr:phospho-sugar mutase [uncultured Rummeliibacillus sp.]
MQPTILYKKWQSANVPQYLKQELSSMENNPVEINDCFYQYLQFGTAGMRGLLGAGTNRLNIFTIRRVAFGLAQIIAFHGKEAKQRGVVISYDNRHFSKEFALETVKVLGEYGVKTFIFSEMRPTPELSFAIRHLHAYVGVMITASHNPKEYNGFKVYGEDGAQLTPHHVDMIVHMMDNVDDIFAIQVADLEALKQAELHSEILEDIDTAFQQNLQTISERSDVKKDLSIIYTPLHGIGYIPVMQGLANAGFTNVHVVEQQIIQDGDFPTVTYPNPESPAAFEMAIDLGKKVSADLLLATDPDSDRLGVAVRTKDGYELLTGNQVGALVTDYLIQAKLEKNTLPFNAVLIKTIVTSELGAKIASRYNIGTINTLTGFKYIAEKIHEFETTNNYSYLFGYEESYGYLVKSYVRDKDAVQMAVLIAEIAGYYAKAGQTLLDALEELYQTYGYHREALVSKVFKGQSGQQQIAVIMEKLRRHSPKNIADINVNCVEDYLTGKANFADGYSEDLFLPKENVLKFKLEDESWIAIRPSGTEPKCKYYFGVVGETAEIADKKLLAIQEAFEKLNDESC